jgi:hypothetical protein
MIVLAVGYFSKVVVERSFWKGVSGKLFGLIVPEVIPGGVSSGNTKATHGVANGCVICGAQAPSPADHSDPLNDGG